MSFFAIDDNLLINIDRIDRVEQKVSNNNVKIIIYVNGKRLEVKRDIKKFLDMIKHIGTEETTRAW